MKFTTEMLEKAKAAKTAEELLEMAKAENVEMTAEEAAKCFAVLHKSGELSDEELGNVAGGCYNKCPSNRAETEGEVVFLFEAGQYVEVFGTTIFNTNRAEITQRKTKCIRGWWYPYYRVRYTDGDEEWVDQGSIQVP